MRHRRIGFNRDCSPATRYIKYWDESHECRNQVKLARPSEFYYDQEVFNTSLSNIAHKQNTIQYGIYHYSEYDKISTAQFFCFLEIPVVPSSHKVILITICYSVRGGLPIMLNQFHSNSKFFESCKYLNLIYRYTKCYLLY